MNSFGKKCKIVMLSVLALLLLTGHAWAISLSFSLPSSDVYIGDSVSMDIIISGLETNNISSFSFTLDFDSAILSFDSYALGTGLGDLTAFEALDTSSGAKLVETSLLSDFSLQPDSFTLASVTFTGIGLGNSSLGISDLILFGDAGNIAATVAPSEAIDVIRAPVPEPSTIFLLGSGFAGLAFYRRKKK